MQVQSKQKLFFYKKIIEMHEHIKSDLYKFVKNNPDLPKPDVVSKHQPFFDAWLQEKVTISLAEGNRTFLFK